MSSTFSRLSVRCCLRCRRICIFSACCSKADRHGPTWFLGSIAESQVKRSEPGLRRGDASIPRGGNPSRNRERPRRSMISPWIGSCATRRSRSPRPAPEVNASREPADRARAAISDQWLTHSMRRLYDNRYVRKEDKCKQAEEGKIETKRSPSVQRKRDIGHSRRVKGEPRA